MLMNEGIVRYVSEKKTVTNGCSTNHTNDVFGWYSILVMLVDYV